LCRRPDREEVEARDRRLGEVDVGRAAVDLCAAGRREVGEERGKGALRLAGDEVSQRRAACQGSRCPGAAEDGVDPPLPQGAEQFEGPPRLMRDGGDEGEVGAPRVDGRKRVPRRRVILVEVEELRPVGEHRGKDEEGEAGDRLAVVGHEADHAAQRAGERGREAVLAERLLAFGETGARRGTALTCAVTTTGYFS
jgi:hypothetical protein